MSPEQPATSRAQPATESAQTGPAIQFKNPAWKRPFDLVAGIGALVILTPFMAVIALLVRSKLGTPVLFRQTRPGLGGEPFEMLKFRTMTDAVDEQGQPLPDAERLTEFGATLRRTSLDELPEFINVVRGDMSIVGPRPLLMDYLPLYNEAQMQRHAVRPGVTGLAQVSGRNAITWPEKFAKDTEYVEHLSPGLDASIILRTIKEVFAGTGVSSGDLSVGMERFTGNG